MKSKFLKQSWLVLVLALVFAGALAAVDLFLRGPIEENQINETYDRIGKLVKGADKAETVEYLADDGKVAYKALTSDKRHVGWVIRAAGAGFADKIVLLIGLDPKAETITGLYVLDQKETPNLGSKITEDKWTSRFSGKKAAESLEITRQKPPKGTNLIPSVSGATISSESVCTIVNKAVAEFRQKLDSLKIRNKP